MTNAATSSSDLTAFDSNRTPSLLPAIVMGMCFLSMIALVIAPHRIGI